MVGTLLTDDLQSSIEDQLRQHINNLMSQAQPVAQAVVQPVQAIGAGMIQAPQQIQSTVQQTQADVQNALDQHIEQLTQQAQQQVQQAQQGAAQVLGGAQDAAGQVKQQLLDHIDQLGGAASGALRGAQQAVQSLAPQEAPAMQPITPQAPVLGGSAAGNQPTVTTLGGQDQTQPTTSTQPVLGGGGGGGAPSSPIDASSPSAFAQSIAPYAQYAASKLGIDPKWVAAMAASESNYGNAPGNELFGIKGSGTAGSQQLATHEGEYGGVATTGGFAAYNSPLDATNAFINLIQQHYPNAVGAQDLGSFVHGLKQGGYFTAAEDEYKGILSGITNRIGGAVDSALGAGQQAIQNVQQAVAQPSQDTGRVFPVVGYNDKVQDHWGSVLGGSDLMAPRGTPVVAMEGGKVVESGWNNVGGNSVLIQGRDGNQYYYAHLNDAPSVKVGQQVDAGTYLGPVGNTGDASGGPTHLHIGIGPDIKLGADKYGGTGGDYDAVGLLRQTLTGQQQGGGQPSQATDTAAGPAAIAPPTPAAQAQAKAPIVMGGMQDSGGQPTANQQPTPIQTLGETIGNAIQQAVQQAVQGAQDLNRQTPGQGAVQAVQTLGGQAGQALGQRAEELGSAAQDLNRQTPGVGAVQAATPVLGAAGQALTDFGYGGPIGAQNAAVRALGQGVTDVAQNLPSRQDVARAVMGKGAEISSGDQIPGAPGASNVIGGGLQLAGGVLGSPSLMESMQTILDLNQKYANAPNTTAVRGSDGQRLVMAADPNDMTPEDRQQYRDAMMAVGGLENPETPDILQGMAVPRAGYVPGTPEHTVETMLQDAARQQGTRTPDLTQADIQSMPGMTDSRLRGLQDVRDAIEAGLPAARWYQEVVQQIRQDTGQDINPREAAVLMGAFGGNAGVPPNYHAMLSVFDAMRQTRPDLTGFENMTPEQIKATPAYQAVDAALTADKAYADRDMLARVMRGYRTGEIPVPSGAKLLSYTQDFLHALNEQYAPFSTQDVWQGRLFGGRPDVQPSNNPLVNIGSNDATYRTTHALTNWVAREMNIPPDQAQAAGWTVYRILSNDKTIGPLLNSDQIGLGDAIKMGQQAGLLDPAKLAQGGLAEINAPRGTNAWATKIADLRDRIKSNGSFNAPPDQPVLRVPGELQVDPRTGRVPWLLPEHEVQRNGGNTFVTVAGVGDDAAHLIGQRLGADRFNHADPNATTFGGLSIEGLSRAEQARLTDALQAQGLAVLRETAGTNLRVPLMDGLPEDLGATVQRVLRDEGLQQRTITPYTGATHAIESAGQGRFGSVGDNGRGAAGPLGLSAGDRLRASLFRDARQQAFGGRQLGQAYSPFTARLAGAAFGGYAGNLATPSDATPEERLRNIGLGASAGLLGTHAVASALERGRLAPEAVVGRTATEGFRAPETPPRGADVLRATTREPATGRGGMPSSGPGGAVRANPHLLREAGPGETPMTLDERMQHGDALEQRYAQNAERLASIDEQLRNPGQKPERPPWAAGWSNDQLIRIARRHGENAYAPLWWERAGLDVGSGEVRENVGQGGFQNANVQREPTPAELRAERNTLEQDQRDLEAAGEQQATAPANARFVRPEGPADLPFDTNAPRPPGEEAPTGSPELTRLRDMYSQPTPSQQATAGDRRAAVFRSLTRLFTDRQVDINQTQERYAANMGRPLQADEMAAELQRLASSPAAQQNVDEGLKPAIQSVGEDYGALRDLVTLRSNVEVAKGLGNAARTFSGGLSPQESAQALRDLEAELGPARWAKVSAAADQVSAFNKSLRDRLVESGVLSPEQAAQMERLYPNWAKTRILDYMADPTGGQGAGTKIGLNDRQLRSYTLEGTAKAREDPLASTVAYAHQVERMAMKNEAFNAFLNLDKASDTPQLRKVSQDYSPTRNQVTMVGFVDGQKQKFVTDNKALGEAINGAGVMSSPEWTSAWQRVFRSLATSRNPLFLAGNAALDIPTYVLREATRMGGPQHLPAIMSELVKGYADAFQGLFQNEFRGEATGRFLRGGGGQSGYFTGNEGLSKQTVEELRRANVFQINGKADLGRLTKDLLTLQPVESLGERIELGPRVAAMRLAERRGANRVQAIIDGRTVTVDFSQGGTFTKYVNNFIPFFNVQFQGPAQIARAFRENPRAAVATVGSLIGLPTAMVQVWNRSDPQRSQDYDDVPDNVKQQGVVVMLPGDAPVDAQGDRKPMYAVIKLREWTPFAAIARDAVDGVIKRDPRAIGDLAGSIGQQTPVIGSAGSLTQAGVEPLTGIPLLPAGMQLQANRDFFRNRDIVTQRNDQNASAVAKGLAPVLQRAVDAAGISAEIRPSAIDFLIQNQGAGVGSAALGAGNLAAGQPPDSVGVGPTSLPVVGGLIGRFAGNRTGQELQDARDQAFSNQTRQTLRANGIQTTIGPVGSSVGQIPLTQEEETQYQRLANQYVDEVVQKVAASPGFAERTQIGKQGIMDNAIQGAKARAAAEVLKPISTEERKRRMQAAFAAKAA